MKKLPYKEGTWFKVPLRTDGYALGVVARMAPNGRVFLGYFFGPKRIDPCDLKEICVLTPDQAILSLMVGDLGLINGQWAIVGNCENWSRLGWAIPNFIRIERLTGQIYLVEYDGNDPSQIIKETKMKEEDSKNLQEDILAGYGSTEIKLTKLLDTTW